MSQKHILASGNDPVSLFDSERCNHSRQVPIFHSFYCQQRLLEETYCYKKYLEAQSILFCNERMCDASCDKYTFLEVKEAEEKASFDFECREEVLGAGNHICYEDAAQTDIKSISNLQSDEKINLR